MSLSLRYKFPIEKNVFVSVPLASLHPCEARCVERVRPPAAHMLNGPSIWDVGEEVLSNVRGRGGGTGRVCVCVCARLVVGNGSCPEQIFKVNS